MAVPNNVNLYKAMDQYFLFKKTFENNRTTAKNKILKNEELTKEEKKSAMAALNEKCINCKRNVGTTFSENERTFKIVCGDVSKPCNLNIEFVIGKKEHYDDIVRGATETVNELKEKIIHLKAELIYGYKNDSEIKEEFTTIKNEYNNFQNILESIVKRKKKITNKNSSQIESLKQTLAENINIIKNNTKEYLEDKDPSHITDNIRLYNTEIKELLTDIKKNKYATNYIKEIQNKKEGEYFYLVQETTALNDLYVSLFKEDASQLINFSS